MEPMSIQRDTPVVATDGELGRVKHVVVDPQTREVTDLVVGKGRHEWLIPMKAVAGVDGDRILLNGASTQFRAGPAFHREQFEAVNDQTAEAESAGVALHDGAPLQAADEDTVVVGEVPAAGATAERLDQTYPVVGDEAETEVTPAPTTLTLDTEGAAQHLELKEERLRVEKEEVHAGVVRVRKVVNEWVETVRMPLREERLVLEVLPGSGTVTIDGRELQAGDVFEVPLLEERLNVAKETVVSEDVIVRKEAVEVEEQFEETLRREELVVDEEGDLDVRDEDLAQLEPAKTSDER